LFRRILGNVVAGKIWSVSGDKFEELAPTINTLTAMLNCLVVVPDDHELDALVRRARLCIMETFMMCMLEGNTMAADPDRAMGGIQSINLFLELVDDARWQELKHETLDSRWARFQATYLSASPEVLAKKHKASAKKLKKICQDGIKISADLSGGEMCANCHVLEASLQNGLKLSKCARCQQIKYCSRTCQAEHWKRAHKKLCAKTS
jgi:hypothetical protein